ncbi:MAG TPA: phosphoribosyltransferase, partial [Bacteroidia bacterium]|nr:phosphoribosyltransferase [Bacteroidia bacterium]
MENRQVILNHDQIQQKLRRIACQIYEDNINEKSIYIAGIARSGYVMAAKLRDIILERYPLKVI